MWGGLLLGVGVYVLFAIVPMIGNVIISFTDYTALPGVAVHNLGFSNYTSMFSTEAAGFEPAIVATLVFVVAVTLGQNVIALLFAHKLKGSGKFAAVGRLLVFLPIALEAAIRLRRTPRWPQALFLGLAVAGSLLSDQQSAVLVIILVAVILLPWLLGASGWDGWAGICGWPRCGPGARPWPWRPVTTPTWT